MTERRSAALGRSDASLRIGPSALHWDGDVLTAEFAESAAPLPRPVRGRVRLRPEAPGHRGFLLDAAGRHRWRPIAAAARVEVELDQPRLRWSGPGYFDSNDGDAPLEEDFRRWDWCRAPLRRGAAVLYNVVRRDGSAQSLALRVHPSGAIEDMPAPPVAALPRSRWWLDRPTRADPGPAPRVVQTLQDAPFYARSVIETRLCGEAATAVHESLDLDRFRAPWVQAMLPFRIPRALR
ncbi:carotenoid 1,2-hydratase [Roseicella sp. DB1501]|uniref:carotenoid 1,2-hydratase n=1 Tax=Roseicella sp. DB1501 TaxID=2730925 RepID=UPI0020C298A8|nr:carotenoid 1,2-hydratase [Roseicella sp. DB1501]